MQKGVDPILKEHLALLCSDSTSDKAYCPQLKSTTRRILLKPCYLLKKTRFSKLFLEGERLISHAFQIFSGCLLIAPVVEFGGATIGVPSNPLCGFQAATIF